MRSEKLNNNLWTPCIFHGKSNINFRSPYGLSFIKITFNIAIFCTFKRRQKELLFISLLRTLLLDYRERLKY